MWKWMIRDKNEALEQGWKDGGFTQEVFWIATDTCKTVLAVSKWMNKPCKYEYE